MFSTALPEVEGAGAVGAGGRGRGDSRKALRKAGCDKPDFFLDIEGLSALLEFRPKGASPFVFVLGSLLKLRFLLFALAGSRGRSTGWNPRPWVRGLNSNSSSPSVSNLMRCLSSDPVHTLGRWLERGKRFPP